MSPLGAAEYIFRRKVTSYVTPPPVSQLRELPVYIAKRSEHAGLGEAVRWYVTLAWKMHVACLQGPGTRSSS